MAEQFETFASGNTVPWEQNVAPSGPSGQCDRCHHPIDDHDRNNQYYLSCQRLSGPCK